MSKVLIGLFLRAPYNYDADLVSKETGLFIDEKESVTQQSFRDECDINEIVRRFGLTGDLPQNVQMPISGDFRAITDFQSAMETVTKAQHEFMSLPASIRDRFANDPARLIGFLEDDANRDEAIKLGLVNKPPEKTRDVVAAVDELKAVLTPKA
ncbi:MAG: internal scaffolding protein [Arizlama microvirus]|nr:MAG: internal scaffolding protein [Arizlama microvirus]